MVWCKPCFSLPVSAVSAVEWIMCQYHRQELSLKHFSKKRHQSTCTIMLANIWLTLQFTDCLAPLSHCLLVCLITHCCYVILCYKKLNKQKPRGEYRAPHNSTCLLFAACVPNPFTQATHLMKKSLRHPLYWEIKGNSMCQYPVVSTWGTTGAIEQNEYSFFTYYIHCAMCSLYIAL